MPFENFLGEIGKVRSVMEDFSLQRLRQTIHGNRKKRRTFNPAPQQPIHIQGGSTPGGRIMDPLGGGQYRYGTDEAMRVAAGQSYRPPPMQGRKVTGYQLGEDGKPDKTKPTYAASLPLRGTWYQARPGITY